MTAATDSITISFDGGKTGEYSRARCCAFFGLSIADNSAAVSMRISRFEVVYRACCDLVESLVLPKVPRTAALNKACELLSCPLVRIIEAVRTYISAEVAVLLSILEHAPKFAELCVIRPQFIAEPVCRMAIREGSSILPRVWCDPGQHIDAYYNVALHAGKVSSLKFILETVTERPSVEVLTVPISREMAECLVEHGVRDPEMITSAAKTRDTSCVEWLLAQGIGPKSAAMIVAIRTKNVEIIELLLPRVEISHDVILAALELSHVGILRYVLRDAKLDGFKWNNIMSIEPEFLTFARERGMNLENVGYMILGYDRPDLLDIAGIWPDFARLMREDSPKCAEVYVSRNLADFRHVKHVTGAVTAAVRASPALSVPRRFYACCSDAQLCELRDAGKLTDRTMYLATKTALKYNMMAPLMFFVTQCGFVPSLPKMREEIVAYRSISAEKSVIGVLEWLIDHGKIPEEDYGFLPYQCHRRAIEKWA